MDLIKNMKAIEDDNSFKLFNFNKYQNMIYSAVFKNWFLGVLSHKSGDKISYLVRRTKAHAKSYEWLDNRLAWFFANKNLEGGKK